MLRDIELWRRCQPLECRPMPASTRAQRFLQHERRNVFVRGCRNLSILACFYWMQILQGVRFSDILVLVVQATLG